MAQVPENIDAVDFADTEMSVEKAPVAFPSGQCRLDSTSSMESPDSLIDYNEVEEDATAEETARAAALAALSRNTRASTRPLTESSSSSTAQETLGQPPMEGSAIAETAAVQSAVQGRSAQPLPEVDMASFSVSPKAQFFPEKIALDEESVRRYVM